MAMCIIYIEGEIIGNKAIQEKVVLVQVGSYESPNVAKARDRFSRGKWWNQVANWIERQKRGKAVSDIPKEKIV